MSAPPAGSASAAPQIAPAESRGLPSAWWRFGQDRRMAMIADSMRLEGATVLDLGCGVGAYSQRLADRGAAAIGLEVEWPRALDARSRGLNVITAVGERLPLADSSVDGVLLHEVLEHVADDRRTLREVARVLVPDGRVMIFVPNRGWPFETHGVVWRGRYRFGNIPLVNYLPDALRNRLAPHVRIYTGAGLRALLEGLPLEVERHTQVFPGYDKMAARRPSLARLLRGVSYALEHTPARRLGLSHFLVARKVQHEDDRSGPTRRRLPVRA